MIELRGISKRYPQSSGEVEVLQGLNLKCVPGDFVSLMGASGAGKSTLLQILGCLDTPSGGSYLMDGEDISKLGEVALASIRNRRIGFVFQSSHFVDYLDLVENVALPGLYERNRITGAHRKRARALLAEVGLDHRASHLPAALSGGERQRAAMARALFNSPDLILADEPTGNLDADSADRIMALLRQVQGDGRALIVVTHDARVAARAQRQLRLEHGTLVDDFAAAA